jgi:hypothetical protein
VNSLIKIYGERNTNTNYLEKLIDLNLDTTQVSGVAPGYVRAIQKLLPGKEWLRDLYFGASANHNLGWKHARAKSPGELEDLGVLQRKVCFVTITKNPYSFLLSLYRRPYSHQFGRVKPDFESFLQAPWKTVARDNCKPLLESPIALWNTKNASYLPLTELGGLNLTTESTVDDPAAVIQKISEHFSISRLSESFVNYEKSTKDASKNFSYYKDYYLNERWRDDLSGEAISIINQSVDRQLMNYFGFKVLAE